MGDFVKAAKATFPQYVDELVGIANGAQVSVDEVGNGVGNVSLRN